MVQYKTKSEKIFDLVNELVLLAIALVCVLPFVHVLMSSFTPAAEILQKGFVLFPEHPTLDAYRYVFSTNTFVRSLGVSVFITFFGTLINMAMTLTMAYALSYEKLVGRRVFNFMVLFSMLFSGGMIPGYLVVRNLGLIDSFWALMLPGAINSFNLIVVRNAFQEVPKELSESARIDGANDVVILCRIILPVMTSTIAAFSLFYAVGHWNTFFNAILYINDAKKWPIQVLLRNIVILSQGGLGDSTELDSNVVVPPETMKMAVVVIATFPILCVYPFLQKYFAKGVLVGSVKG